MNYIISSKAICSQIASFLLLCSSAISQSLDTSFDPGLGPNNGLHTTAIQQDGKILIGGEFTEVNGIPANGIARLNVDGSVDPSFNIGTGANGQVYTISIQEDGKIIVGGEFSTFNEANAKALLRLNVDGSIDSMFNIGLGPGISFQTTSVLTSIIQQDGKIIVGGNFLFFNGDTKNRVARLNIDGSLDTSFDIGNTNFMALINNRIRALAMQSDGRIIVGGEFSNGNIARLNTNGSLDNSFNSGTGTNNSIRTISIQNDDKIIIGGWFTLFNGTPENRIARLNSDGSLDATFETGNPITLQSYQVRATAIQSDGKIFMAGTIYTYMETLINNFARLNSDGSLDTSFDLEAGVVGNINTISIQNDGRIIIGGRFNSYYGSEIWNLARIDTISSTVGFQSFPKKTKRLNIFPNPFTTESILSLNISENHHVSLRIYDIQGKEVAVLADQRLSPGKHQFVFQGSNLNSGIYIYQLRVSGNIETGKLVLNK